MSSGQLLDASTQTMCVASEAAGTDTRLQCSNDLDYINGVAVIGGFGISQGLLSYSGSTTWYGCGVLDLANGYEPNGLTYSTKNGDSSNCRACTLKQVFDISMCAGQAPAASISTNYLPAYTAAV